METNLTEILRARLEKIRAEIDSAARQAGRAPETIRLMVVTKTHPAETVAAALAAGARLLGENYAEEAVQKITALNAPQAEWHMIGHVQSRKADLVARHFQAMQSLDSLRLATRLQRFAAEAGRILPVFLECNVSGEASKFGYPAQTASERDLLFREVEQILLLPNLRLCGLMTMPPFSSDPQRARPYFARLRELAEALHARFPQADWRELSMGTSADFPAAVLEGASLVRVGTAILGARPPKNE